MVFFCHEFCMKRLGEGTLSTYAELHRHLEGEFDIKVSAEALRLRLLKDFDYIFGKIAYDKNSIRITYQTRRFLLLYSGQYHLNLDPHNVLIRYATDAVREQKRETNAILPTWMRLGYRDTTA